MSVSRCTHLLRATLVWWFDILWSGILLRLFRLYHCCFCLICEDLPQFAISIDGEPSRGNFTVELSLACFTTFKDGNNWEGRHPSALFASARWYPFSSWAAASFGGIDTMVSASINHPWLICPHTPEINMFVPKAAIPNQGNTTSLRMTNYRHTIANWSTASNEPRLTWLWVQSWDWNKSFIKMKGNIYEWRMKWARVVLSGECWAVEQHWWGLMSMMKATLSYLLIPYLWRPTSSQRHMAN